MLNDNVGEGTAWHLKYLEWLKKEMKIFSSLSSKKTTYA